MATRIFLCSLGFLLAVQGQAAYAGKDICDSNSFYISFNIGLNSWDIPLNPNLDRNLICALDTLKLPVKYYLSIFLFPSKIINRISVKNTDENQEIYNGNQEIADKITEGMARNASNDIIRSIKKSIPTIKGNRGNRVWVNVNMTRCEKESYGIFHEKERMNWHRYTGWHPCSIGSKNGLFGIGYGLNEHETILETYEAIPSCIEEANKKLYNGELQLKTVKNGLLDRLLHVESCYTPVFNHAINK